jgi:hypothetical protein
VNTLNKCILLSIEPPWLPLQLSQALLSLLALSFSNLHLFEPRYRLMMQRVVNSTRAFAYVPNFSTYHANVGDVALVANIKEVDFLAGM